MRTYLNVIAKSEIEKTDAFKALSKIQKSICLNWNNIKAIDNGLKVAQNRGVEYWEKNCNPSHINKPIIKELLCLTTNLSQ